MKAFAICALALCVALAASEVIDAKDSDFDEIVKKNTFSLVKFYAPWCGHCKRLAPEWDKAAEQLGEKAGIIKVDCTVEKALGERFGVRSYPTIKVFRNGEMAGDYDGGRTADAIVKYVQAHLGPAVSAVATAIELDTLKNENDVLVVAFADDEGTSVAVSHAAVAAKLRSRFKFALVTDVSLRDGSGEQIIVYKKFDSRRDVFEGNVGQESEIAAFVTESSVRLFDEMGPENYKGYIDRQLPIAWLFVKPTAADFAALKDNVAAVAPSAKGKVSFVWVDAEKYGNMAERLGVKKGVFPAFVIDKSGEHFVLAEDKEITTENVADFTANFMDGKLSVTIRSEEAPEVHTKDGLTTVVGSTFTELVVNSGMDVFIEFYAPWCGHCKKLQPVMERVGKELANVEGLRIAQIDASSNDFNNKMFNVQGFPTIYFIPRGGEPIAFEGDRTANGIFTFLKEKSSAKFEIPADEREEL